MLLLARRINEKIMIGDYIEVQLVRIEGNKAVIGISAPREITIDRQEIRDKKQSILRKIFGFTNHEVSKEGNHYAI